MVVRGISMHVPSTKGTILSNEGHHPINGSGVVVLRDTMVAMSALMGPIVTEVNGPTLVALTME
jgi:hypothetical protein